MPRARTRAGRSKPQDPIIASSPGRPFQTKKSAAGIAATLETAIREGRLRPGESLPTVRELARQSSVSSATAARAYRLLRQRGWITADGRRGTHVSPGPPSGRQLQPPAAAGLRDLSDGNPDPLLLPALRPALERLDVAPLLYGAELKSARLLDLARKQFERDGIDAEHVAVTSGALDGIERVLSACLRPGDRVVVEDPGFAGVIELVRALGLVALPMRIDREGPHPGTLRGLLGEPRRKGTAAAQALIVTPRAQNPTGLAITERRRRILVNLLARYPNVLLIEDDHAAGVAGIDAVTLVRKDAVRWAVVRSVSKSLGPDLRVAVVAGDSGTITGVEGRQAAAMGWVSHILQELVAQLWASRELRSALRKAERIYERRRRGLLEALERHGIHGSGVSGMNVWIRVGSEIGIVENLRRAGWASRPRRAFSAAVGPCDSRDDVHARSR